MADSDFHFSATVYTDDLAVLGCLRGLCQFAEATGDVRIASGGTDEPEWFRDEHHATFRFTTVEKRTTFLTEATRLLPVDSWWLVRESDADPATPQS